MSTYDIVTLAIAGWTLAGGLFFVSTVDHDFSRRGRIVVFILSGACIWLIFVIVVLNELLIKGIKKL